MKTLNILKTALLLLLTTLYSNQVNSQSLSAGDIAIIGVGVDTEEILLVALADVSSGESVFFTDEEWNGNSFNSGEGFYVWITPSISAGSVFTLTKTSVSVGGTVSQLAGNMALGNSGDGFFLYQTSDNLYNSGTYTLIAFAGEDSGDAGTLSGSGLAIGTTAVYFGGDNGVYTGSRGSNDKPGHLNNIYNDNNWATSGSAQTFDSTNFIMLGSGAGITLSGSSGNTNESGTTATFTAVLNAAPVSDVVLNVTSGDTGEVTVTPSQLTFTSSNWDTPQTITITGLDDSDEDGDIDVTITVAVDDALSDAAYAGLSETTTVTNEDDDFPNIVITEFMYNTPGTDDEWIELYNSNGSDVDISTWTLNVGTNTFTFPPSTNFPNNTYITIAMGSNGDGTFNNDNPFTPDYSNVSDPLESTNDTNNMSNGAATITLENIASTIIDSVAYDDGDVSSTDGSGPSYEIIDTTADNSTTASNWQASIFNGGTPGNTETSWTGTTSSDWATATNWSTGVVPTSSDIVFIDGTFTNEPAIISTDAAVNSLFVASGNTLTIDETSSLTVSGDFTNTGSVTLNSTADDFSSLIVEGTASGDILYNRFVNVYDDLDGGGWDFVGSPNGMTIADFITANGANIQVLGDDYAFAQYDNATGQYTRYATDNSDTGSFSPAQGYAMAISPEDLPPPPAGGVPGTTVTFTGTMQTTDQSINVINNDGLNNVGRRWNLVSNPFPSYIVGNTAAGVTNFIDANSAVIDSERLAVYGWNGSDYTIYNQLSGAFSMAPGQGFWVAAASTSDAALDFTAAMRTTTGTGDFVSGPQLLTYNVGLKLYNGEIERAATNFYFRNGLTLGLDPGYDAAAYNQSTKLSSRLAQGSQETAFAINAMDINDLQNTRVPLEIRQNAGQAFTISIADMELPQDISVYLEDTLNGTLTSLKDGDFELTAQSNLSGVDRFFIVFKDNSVLSNGDTLGINALNVYKANTDSFVTIAGITPELGQLNATIFNILGMTVREKALNPATATQTISTQGLVSGLYIIQLKSGNQVFTKKIVVH